MCGCNSGPLLVSLASIGAGQAERMTNATEALPQLTCPTCRTAITPEFAWCPKCGAALKAHPCTYCGQTVHPGEDLCGFCGAPTHKG